MKTNIIVSCLTILLIMSGFQILYAIKISISEISMNNNTMRIRIKLLSDDLSSILSQNFRENISFKGTELDSAFMEYIHSYIQSNFAIAINNVPVLYTFKSFSINRTATKQIEKIWLIYECVLKNTEAIKTLELKNTLLFEGIPDQKNISKIILNHKAMKTLTFTTRNKDIKKAVHF